MNIVLATLCLNEMEWIPKLYQQHRNWPEVVKWVFVEAADVVYRETNPSLVSDKGLSVDGTSDFLASLGDRDNKIHYIAHGFTGHSDKAQGKCQARQRYLDVCSGMHPRPDFIIVLDADEFYTEQDQLGIVRSLRAMPSSFNGLIFKQRHIWYPPAVQGSSHVNGGLYGLFQHEVAGGYWAVPHCRVWRYVLGMRYANNHNTPESISGRSFKDTLRRYDKLPVLGPGMSYPECIHMGYASVRAARQAKHNYYIARGEGKESGRMGKQRTMYVDCRAAWERWREGDELPHGARVIPYTGVVPECFNVGPGMAHRLQPWAYEIGKVISEEQKVVHEQQ